MPSESYFQVHVSWISHLFDKVGYAPFCCPITLPCFFEIFTEVFVVWKKKAIEFDDTTTFYSRIHIGKYTRGNSSK